MAHNFADSLHQDSDTAGYQATERAASIYAEVRQLEAQVKTLRRLLEQEVAAAEAHGMSHEQIANTLDVSRTRVDQMIQAATGPVKLPRPPRD
jgi:DNA-directed RNA polymerase specialized sigma24 family protein